LSQARVSFVTTVGYVEFSVESRANVYSVQVYSDGHETITHNCKVVSVFPKSPLLAPLVKTVERVKPLVLRYFASSDSPVMRSVLYYKIRQALEEVES